MKRYDPEIQPLASEWLLLDEQLRIELAEEHHRAERVKLPNRKVHAVFHVIAENQIAEGLEPVIRAMERLMNQGLSRHEALHAVGSIVADFIHEGMNTKDGDASGTVQARYNAAVERLTAQGWKKKYEE